MYKDNPHRWKPGQSGNPGGKPKLPAELRVINALTPMEVARYIAKYARLKKEDIEIAAKNPDTPVIELAIASVFSHAISFGDYGRLNFLLDRAIGKVPVVTETPAEAATRQELQGLSDQELVAMIKEKLPELKEA